MAYLTNNYLLAETVNNTLSFNEETDELPLTCSHIEGLTLIFIAIDC